MQNHNSDILHSTLLHSSWFTSIRCTSKHKNLKNVLSFICLCCALGTSHCVTSAILNLLFTELICSIIQCFSLWCQFLQRLWHFQWSWETSQTCLVTNNDILVMVILQGTVQGKWWRRNQRNPGLETLRNAVFSHLWVVLAESDTRLSLLMHQSWHPMTKERIYGMRWANDLILWNTACTECEFGKLHVFQ